MKNFTAKQKEIIARKLGYDGPMQGFDEFVQSSPALAMKYEMINDKYTERMNKGGAVMRYQDGGMIQTPEINIAANASVDDKKKEYSRLLSQGFDDKAIRTAAEFKFGKQTDADWQALSGVGGSSKEKAAADASTKNAEIIAKVRERFPNYDPNKMTMDYSPADQYYGELLRGGTADDGKKRINPADRNKETNPPTGGGGAAGGGNITISIDPATATPQQKAAEYNRLRSQGFTDEQIKAAATTKFGAQAAADWSKLQDIASKSGTTLSEKTPGMEYTETGVPKAGAIKTVQAQQTAVDTGKLTAADYNLGAVTDVTAKTATAQQVSKPDAVAGQTMTAATSQEKMKTVTEGITGAQGTVSRTAEAAQGQLSDASIAKAAQKAEAAKIADVAPLEMTDEMRAKAARLADVGGAPKAQAETTGREIKVDSVQFETPTPTAQAVTDYNLPPTQTATLVATGVREAAKAGVIPQEIAQETAYRSTLEAQRRDITENEIVDVARQNLKIDEPVQAVAATMDKLDSAAVAIAQQGSFSQALAEAQQGNVEAASTVAGQMSNLMRQFNDGTPAWAAGALRAANAAMAARGLAGSSMAGAAIVQAAMEAATPIAAADAQVFANMQMTNLNNRQQVALANAAAQQQIELANLNARQQAALQNSANSFALQSQNLSNQQAVVLANAQIRASVAEKNLDIRAQAALTNAARYAELNNLNLSNAQQAALQRSAENLQVEMGNLNNRQQTALANLQVRAAITGQELSNEQQMRVLESTQIFESAKFNATAKQQAFIQDATARAALEGQVLSNKQQTALFNASAILEERKINLNNKQEAALQNSANALQLEVQNLSNKQQAAIANAQIEASLKGQELSNEQQVAIANAARVSEIAQTNFTAEQQKALAEAKFINDINVQDMNNKQAVTLANAAAAASMDQANLNARQQANVENARNFLQMDMKNLEAAQQTALFKGRALVEAVASDTAAENVARQTNAANKQQAEQFSAKLAADASQFNTAQANAMQQFNVSEQNALAKFNTEMDTRREEFNSRNRVMIDTANAQLQVQISTANTAAVNAANFQNAQAANNMTMAQYNNEVQLYRDQVKMVYDSYERQEDRAASMATAMLQVDIANKQIDAKTSESYGRLIGAVIGTETGNTIVKGAVDLIKNLFKPG